MSQRTVEVALAFVYICPDCGRENFVRSVLHEFTREEQLEYQKELGQTPQTGSWATHPDQVVCENCGADFRAINPGELVDETA